MIKIIKESITVKNLEGKLIDFLIDNKMYYELDEVSFIKNIMRCDIIEGDWKHEHLRFNSLIKNFCKLNNIECDINRWVEDENSKGDWFSAHYEVEFNIPKE